MYIYLCTSKYQERRKVHLGGYIEQSISYSGIEGSILQLKNIVYYNIYSTVISTELEVSSKKC